MADTDLSKKTMEQQAPSTDALLDSNASGDGSKGTGTNASNGDDPATSDTALEVWQKNEIFEALHNARQSRYVPCCVSRNICMLLPSLLRPDIIDRLISGTTSSRAWRAISCTNRCCPPNAIDARATLTTHWSHFSCAIFVSASSDCP